ncbi:MAG: hypothetical protein DHS20C03_27010 [Minwuia thermotolerans]|nr:MAG: hypothetical protein DHS20C03_27010 [Minwuia thermotolerans]
MKKTLFATRLKSKRRVRNLSQADLATILGVSTVTVHRWENGEALPDGKHVQKLISNLDFRMSELDQLYEQFYLNNEVVTQEYYVGGYDFVYEKYPTWEDFLQDLIELDLQETKNLSLEQEGTAEHWAPIFERNPSTWRLVVYNNRIVGYWHYLVINRNAFNSVISGNFREENTTEDQLEEIIEEGRYRMLISHVVLDGAHRVEKARATLRKSFVLHLRELAKGGFFFESICAYAFTKEGRRLCELLGMKEYGDEYIDDKAVFCVKGGDIGRKGLLSRDKAIARLYRDQFVSTD